MGMGINEIPVLIILQAVLLDVLLMETSASEPVLPRGVEVGVNSLCDFLVPFVSSKDFSGQDRSEYGAGVVIPVIDPFMGVCPA